MKTVHCFTHLLGICAALFVGTGCESDSPSGWGEDTPRHDIVLTTKSEKVNARVQDFSFRFLREMAGEEKSNFCVSPLSASLCLGMVLNGAEGNTLAELRETLGYGDLSKEEINAYARQMQEELPKMDGRTIFTNANSIWVREGIPVLEDFVKVNREAYAAEVSNVPFNEATLEKINRWCADKTNDLIPEILAEIDPYSAMYLLNALYFKGLWTEKFDEGNTASLPFYLKDGTTKEVPTMHQTAVYNFFSDEEVTMVELPYGNGSFSMVLFMPSDKENGSLDELIAGLDADRWNNWMERSSSDRVDLYLPRFEMRSSMDLIETMYSLGIRDAFDSSLADFSSMVSGNGLFISLILQKTYLKVDEAGTEAAAVTLVDLELSANPSDPTEVRFDRPFGFVLKERSTGAILFAGRVNDPSAD